VKLLDNIFGSSLGLLLGAGLAVGHGAKESAAAVQFIEQNGGARATAPVGDTSTNVGAVLTLLPNAQVDSEGIFLSQVVSPIPDHALPRVRLGDAPALGQAAILTRAQILTVMQKAASELVFTNWAGAERVRIIRLSRTLKEAELKEQLTAVLQRDPVRDRGELELRLVRAWIPVLIPDEPFALKILDLPTAGVSGSFIVRFELVTAHETIGPWQAPVTAKIWRDVWVARSALKRDQLLSEADVVRERRDLLGLREPPLSMAQLDTTVEIAESVPAGLPLYARSVRLRPIVHRGQIVEAQVTDGSMMISLKVEVLENGAPGQLVRVRNSQTKREFRGKVQNEQTILVSL
jgi:flagella basal body P-ring formation protein FlgA